MHILIACSDDPAQVGDTWESTIWNPYVREYVFAITKILRIATQQEYLDFCASHNLPVRHHLLTRTPYYYEIQVMD